MELHFWIHSATLFECKADRFRFLVVARISGSMTFDPRLYFYFIAYFWESKIYSRVSLQPSPTTTSDQALDRLTSAPAKSTEGMRWKVFVGMDKHHRIQ